MQSQIVATNTDCSDWVMRQWLKTRTKKHNNSYTIDIWRHKSRLQPPCDYWI